MDNQQKGPTPQDILVSLQAEVASQSQMLADLTQTINDLADDVLRMRRVIVMMGWLIIIGGAVVFAAWLLSSLSWYWGF